MVLQLCEDTKDHLTVHFKCLNCISIKLLKINRSREELGVCRGDSAWSHWMWEGHSYTSGHSLSTHPCSLLEEGTSTWNLTESALKSQVCWHHLGTWGAWAGRDALACGFPSTPHQSVHLFSIHLGVAHSFPFLQKQMTVTKPLLSRSRWFCWGDR